MLSLESLADMTVNGATEKLTEMADDDPGVDPHTVAQRGLLRGQLLDAIDELPDREREISPLLHRVAQPQEHRPRHGDFGIACVAAAAPRHPPSAHRAQ